MDELRAKQKHLRQLLTALADRCGKCFADRKEQGDYSYGKQEDCHKGCEVHKRIREIEDDLTQVREKIQAYKFVEGALRHAN